MASFDPARSVTFDLGRGQVELVDGEPHILVPATALAAMLAGEGGGRLLGRSIGVGAMGRVSVHLGRSGDRRGRDALRDASLETVVELLGGELAILGLGSLRVERWGSALLFALDPHPLDARADDLVCGVFEGALESVARREVHGLVVDRQESQLRVLVANASAVAEAKRLLDGGAFFTEIVSMLHDEGSRPHASERS